MFAIIAYSISQRRLEKKTSEESFLFTIDEKDKNNYSKKIKFLDE